ncbi:G-protein coupled receptor Mth-like isoform X2 [Anoplophora glabripennis]|nr:G-protein coupled receptor Mth-like isoform X2 [Anoplophora glabripennis]
MFQRSVNFYIVILCLYITNIDGQENNTNISLSEISRNKDARHNVYETDGFTDSVKSGPLLVIDKKNIFIPNLNYDPEDQDTYFWAGAGEPSPSGVLVPDENNSNSPLKSYQGRNIYLQLPENLSADKIDYISVWSIERKISLGHVMLYKNPTVRRKIPDALGYHNRTEDGKTIYRAPFCCEVNEIYNEGGTCTKVPADLPFNLSVFESNETFVDYESVLENVEIVPYKYTLECTEPGYIPLSLNDTYGLVYNSTLYLLNEPGTFSHGSFCIAYDGEQQVVHVCVWYGLKPMWYKPFLIISTICFIITTLVYIFVIKEKNVHRRCFMGYSVSMIIAFFTLACLQEKSPACDSLGAFFMLSLLSSYVWFACLCVDLIFLVKTPKSVPEDTSRFYVYLSISLAIPLLILGASIIPDGTLDVPQSFVKDYSGPNYCRFKG